MIKELLYKKNKGFSLIEVILAISIFALIATALSGVYLYGEENSLLVGNRNRAIFLAQQGLEATRSIRDEDFSNLSNGIYGLGVVGSVWDFVGSSDATDIYERTITISDYDTDVKEVVSTVTWNQNASRTGEVVLTTLLSFWQEVVAVMGNWGSPLLDAVLDFPGNTNASRIDVDDSYAYIILSTNANTDDLRVVNITDPGAIFLEDSIALNGQLRGVEVSGNYVYVSSTDNSQEIQVVDVSNPSNISLVNTINLSGNKNMRELYISGPYLYTTRDPSSDEFHIFNISNPLSITSLGSVNLSTRQRAVYVSGNYAYTVGDANSAEVYVIDISSPASPTQVASLNLSGKNNAIDIAGYGNYIFVNRDNGLTHIIDISAPTFPSLIQTYSIGGVSRGLDVVPSANYIFQASDVNNFEFLVTDVEIPAAPFLVGSYDNLGDDFNDVAYHAGGDFAVLVGDSNTSEVTIVSP